MAMNHKVRACAQSHTQARTFWFGCASVRRVQAAAGCTRLLQRSAKDRPNSRAVTEVNLVSARASACRFLSQNATSLRYECHLVLYVCAVSVDVHCYFCVLRRTYTYGLGNVHSAAAIWKHWCVWLQRIRALKQV